MFTSGEEVRATPTRETDKPRVPPAQLNEHALVAASSSWPSDGDEAAGGAGSEAFRHDSTTTDSRATPADVAELSSSPAAADVAATKITTLPWWKRILVDAAYRATLTELATICYRQELHVLECHPFLLTTPSFPAPSTLLSSAPPLSTVAPEGLGALPSSGAQYVCAPSTPAHTIQLWDTTTRRWRQVLLGTLYGHHDRSHGHQPQPQTMRQHSFPARLPAKPDSHCSSGSNSSIAVNAARCSLCPLPSDRPARNAGASKIITASAASAHTNLCAAKGNPFQQQRQHHRQRQRFEPVAGSTSAFSQHHPKAIQRHAAAAHRSPTATATTPAPPEVPLPSAAAELDPTGAAPVPVSERAGQMLAPLAGAAATAATAADNDEDFFGNGIAGVRRLQRKLQGTAYRAFPDGGSLAEAARAQAGRQRHDLAQHQQRDGSRTAGRAPALRESRRPSPTTPSVPATLPPTARAMMATKQWTGNGMVPAGAATPRAAESAAATANRWAAPPRTIAERELDGLLGLSYFWREALPPSGFVRLAPDPRAAMWDEALAAEEAAARQQQPSLRRTPTRQEQITRPTHFNRALREAFSTPLCIHVFQERNVPQEAATALSTPGFPATDHTPARPPPPVPPRTASPAAGHLYVGTYRQSQLLIHVKIYCRALHDEQQQQQQDQARRCRAREAAAAAARRLQKRGRESRMSPPASPLPLAAAGTNRSLPRRGAMGSDVITTAVDCNTMATPAATATATNVADRHIEGRPQPPAPGTAATDASPWEPLAVDPLRGMPQVPFPVLRIATQAVRHDPLATTSIAAINKAAAFIRGSSDNPTNAGSGKGAAGGGSKLMNHLAQPIPSGMWMGLVATPNTQPPETAAAAACVWRQLHSYSRRARAVMRAIYLGLPRDGEGCLGKDAYIRFVLGLLNLFFPTHLATTVHREIAEEEWVYRGVTGNVTFSAFFDRFFAFPFIFLRDLASVTENDYVDFWETVRLALLKDTTCVETVLAQRVKDPLRSPSSANELNTGENGEGGTNTDAEKDLLEYLQQQRQQQQQQQQPRHASEASADKRKSRIESILYDQQLPHNMDPTLNAAAPLSAFRTAQLRVLCFTDYNQPTGATATRLHPLTAAKPKDALAKPAALASARTPSLVLDHLQGDDKDRHCRTIATGKAAADVPLNTQPHLQRLLYIADDTSQTWATADGLRDDLLTSGDPEDKYSLAALARATTHYKRRHERLKAKCLSAIATHRAVTSTWELHKDDVYDHESDNVSRSAAPVEEKRRDGKAWLPPLSSRSRGRVRALSGGGSSRGSRVSIAAHEDIDATAIANSAKTYSAGVDVEEAKLDRLIQFAADVCDEVFTENRVQVRERFEAYESLQQERIKRA